MFKKIKIYNNNGKFLFEEDGVKYDYLDPLTRGLFNTIILTREGKAIIESIVRNVFGKVIYTIDSRGEEYLVRFGDTFDDSCFYVVTVSLKNKIVFEGDEGGYEDFLTNDVLSDDNLVCDNGVVDGFRRFFINLGYFKKSNYTREEFKNFSEFERFCFLFKSRSRSALYGAGKGNEKIKRLIYLIDDLSTPFYLDGYPNGSVVCEVTDHGDGKSCSVVRYDYS